MYALAEIQGAYDGEEDFFDDDDKLHDAFANVEDAPRKTKTGQNLIF